MRPTCQISFLLFLSSSLDPSSAFSHRCWGSWSSTLPTHAAGGTRGGGGLLELELAGPCKGGGRQPEVELAGNMGSSVACSSTISTFASGLGSATAPIAAPASSSAATDKDKRGERQAERKGPSTRRRPHWVHLAATAAEPRWSMDRSPSCVLGSSDLHVADTSTLRSRPRQARYRTGLLRARPRGLAPSSSLVQERREREERDGATMEVGRQRNGKRDRELGTGRVACQLLRLLHRVCRCQPPRHRVMHRRWCPCYGAHGDGSDVLLSSFFPVWWIGEREQRDWRGGSDIWGHFFTIFNFFLHAASYMASKPGYKPPRDVMCPVLIAGVC